MPDYQSMYYELLKACERAIVALRQTQQQCADILYQYEKRDYDAVYHHAMQKFFDVADILAEAEQRSENIYIDSCEPDEMSTEELIEASGITLPGDYNQHKSPP